MLRISMLIRASKLIKISVLAELAGIPPSTLDAKVRRGMVNIEKEKPAGNELSVTESEQIEKALLECGIVLQEPGENKILNRTIVRKKGSGNRTKRNKKI